MDSRGEVQVRYDFFTSRGVYKFFKAIYIKKKITMAQLMKDSGIKSNTSISDQLKPLIEKGFVEKVIENKIYYYRMNYSNLADFFEVYDITNFPRPQDDFYVISSESFQGLITLVKGETKKERKNILESAYSKLWD